MKVTFTRSVLADGSHQEEGSTAEILDATAALLIAQGAALPAPEQTEVPEPKKGKSK